MSVQALRVRCAWCGALLSDGPEPTSHGICPDCSEKLQAEATPATWTPRDPFIIGRRIGELQALVYSANAGETWDAAVDRRGHMIDHAGDFATKGEAVAHASAVLERERAGDGSQPVTPAHGRLETSAPNLAGA